MEALQPSLNQQQQRQQQQLHQQDALAPKATTAAAVGVVSAPAASPAVDVTVFEPEVEYDATDSVAVDRERATGLLQKIDVLLASFESLPSEDEAALDKLMGKPPATAAGEGAANDAAAEPTPAVSAAAAELTPLASTDSLTTTTTTTKLVLKLPRVLSQPSQTEITPPPASTSVPTPTPTPLASDAPKAEDTGAAETTTASAALVVAPAASGASQVLALTAEALEAMVRPLGPQVANEVLDRIREIGKLLDEQQQRSNEEVSVLEQGRALAGTAAAGAAAAAAAAWHSGAALGGVSPHKTVTAETLTEALEALANSTGAAAAGADETTASTMGAVAAQEAIRITLAHITEAAAQGVEPSSSQYDGQYLLGRALPAAKGAAALLQSPPQWVALPPPPSRPALPPTPTPMPTPTPSENVSADVSELTLGPNWTMTSKAPTPLALGQQPATGTEAVSAAPLLTEVTAPPTEAMPAAVEAVATASHLADTTVSEVLEMADVAKVSEVSEMAEMADVAKVSEVSEVPEMAEMAEMAEPISSAPLSSMAATLPSVPLPQLPTLSAAPTPPPSASPTPAVNPSVASSVLPPPPPPPPPQQQKFIDASSADGSGIAEATRFQIKSNLLDLVYGTSRGLSATPAQRAAIEELLEGLELVNPNAMATEAVYALGGRWKLVYTSNVATLMLLGALDGMPLVDVGDVVQIIDPEGLTATNKIDLAVPLLVSLRAEAGLEVRSPRQFKVRLTRVGLDTYVATPQLLAALEVPPSITVLGATLDLTPLRKLLEPINSGLEAAQDLLGRAVAPEFSMDSVPVPPGISRGALRDVTSLWMLTTYLDDTLRISRDDEGRVFVMLKDVGLYPQTDTTR
ncbi:hypothetical protein Vafri_17794 [Volvox africanus]|uniref:Plastid lipid-associated protein/fibrillin conserved domain-containing protein n=1 Tax=Volvox africanus TaxID=51714 RepID=A0A8J4F713_9CHLO|nr:hypothetical protein Vafri_17794 [Volvox africanus]